MLKKILFLVLIIIFHSCGITKKETSEKQLIEFEIDTSISMLIKDQVIKFPNQTELAVAFTKGDSISYYGVKNINGEADRNENRLTLFEVGSITKVFTSHLLVESIQSGKSQINQPLSDFFDFELHDKKDITLKQLSSHSSGLPNMPDYFFDPLIDSINPYKDYSVEVMLNDLQSNMKLDPQSIGKWDYSNYGVSLLGYIIASQNNLSYEEFLQNNILNPQKMKYTTLNRNNLKAKLALGLTAEGKSATNWDLAAITPAGGLISNVEDLSKYVINCYSELNKVFPFQSKKVLSQQRGNIDQALGWMIYNRKNSKPYCYLHSGQTGGYASIILLQPDAKKSIIILSNISEEGNAILSLGFKLLKGLIEGKYESQK